MQKLRKIDSKVGQTVYSFKCPCGSCDAITFCACNPKSQERSQYTISRHDYNLNVGGSAQGGAGM